MTPSLHSEKVLKEKIDNLHRVKSAVDIKAAELKVIEDEYKQCEEEMISILEDIGLESARGSDGKGVTLIEPAMKVSAHEGKKEEMLKWLKENGYDYAVKETIHQKTLNSQMSIRFKEGQSIPEEIFNIYFVKQLKVH